MLVYKIGIGGGRLSKNDKPKKIELPPAEDSALVHVEKAAKIENIYSRKEIKKK